MKSIPRKTPKGRPFKKFYCDRNGTFLLPPIAFKIWLYHYARENENRKSWPSVETVMKACGLCRVQTFYKWRAYLRQNGWLEKVGEVPPRSKGGLPVPIFRVTRGTIPVKCEKRTKRNSAENAPNLIELSAKNATMPSANNAPNLSAKNAPISRFIEVEPFEEDSKRLKPEVDSGPVKSGSNLNQAVLPENLPEGFIKRGGKVVFVGGAR
jgi:hypothetical protein